MMDIGRGWAGDIPSLQCPIFVLVFGPCAGTGSILASGFLFWGTLRLF